MCIPFPTPYCVALGKVRKKWKFKMAFAIRRRSPPPLNGTNFQTFYYPIFSFAVESYIYETDVTLGLSQISLLSPLIIGSNIDILQQLRLLTANYLAMFKVISTTIYT